jgi:hypothetical protein
LPVWSAWIVFTVTLNNSRSERQRTKACCWMGTGGNKHTPFHVIPFRPAPSHPRTKGMGNGFSSLPHSIQLWSARPFSRRSDEIRSTVCVTEVGYSVDVISCGGCCCQPRLFYPTFQVTMSESSMLRLASDSRPVAPLLLLPSTHHMSFRTRFAYEILHRATATLTSLVCWLAELSATFTNDFCNGALQPRHQDGVLRRLGTVVCFLCFL